MILHSQLLPGEREMLVAWLDKQARSGRSWVALSEIDCVREGIRFAIEHSQEPLWRGPFTNAAMASINGRSWSAATA